MKIIKFFLLIYILFTQSIVLADTNFNEWVLDFKKKAKNEGISSKTVNNIMNKAIFLPKVIQYDRYQPEFYEDTNTYINKRSSDKKLEKGKSLFIIWPFIPLFFSQELFSIVEENSPFYRDSSPKFLTNYYFLIFIPWPGRPLNSNNVMFSAVCRCR